MKINWVLYNCSFDFSCTIRW